MKWIGSKYGTNQIPLLKKLHLQQFNLVESEDLALAANQHNMDSPLQRFLLPESFLECNYNDSRAP